MSGEQNGSADEQIWELAAAEAEIRALIDDLGSSYSVRSVVSTFVPKKRGRVTHYEMVSLTGNGEEEKKSFKQEFRLRLMKRSIEAESEREEVSTDEMYSALMYGKNATVLNIVQIQTEISGTQYVFEFFGNIDLTLIRAIPKEGEKPMGAFTKFLRKEITQSEYMSMLFRQQLAA